METVFFILAGMVSGVVAGMGMGGGTLLIPILTIFLSVSQKSAQGINLLAFIPMAIVVLIIHFKNGLVDIKAGLLIIATGVIFAIGGAILANYISNKSLKNFFGIFLVLIGIFQFVQFILNLKKNFIKNNKKISNFYSTKYYAIQRKMLNK